MLAPKRVQAFIHFPSGEFARLFSEAGQLPKLRANQAEARKQDAHMQIPKKPTVSMYMDSETHALSGDDEILVAVGRLIDEGVTGAPVVDEHGHVVGVLSEYDCLRLLAEGSGGDRARGRVSDFMSTKFTVVPPTMDVYYVAGMFLREPEHRRFLVIEDQQLVGVITRKDILRAVQAGLQGG